MSFCDDHPRTISSRVRIVVNDNVGRKYPFMCFLLPIPRDSTRYRTSKEHHRKTASY